MIRTLANTFMDPWEFINRTNISIMGFWRYFRVKATLNYSIIKYESKPFAIKIKK